MSDSVLFLPEEICTLVIAETFPEDAGIFTCSASNDYGSAASTAQLVVTSGTPGPHCRKDCPKDCPASRSHANNPCFIAKQKAGVGVLGGGGSGLGTVGRGWGASGGGLWETSDESTG